jgi:hypothetical protein
MAVALVAGPEPWTSGYVSETGTPGMPYATAYRVGLLVLAAGVVALGAAMAAAPGAAVGRAAQVAALLLGAAGVLAGISASVPCSTGCPLPPHEAGTAADLVHTAASILGMAALGFAMLVLAGTRTTSAPLRRLAAVAASLTFPLAAVEAVAMLLAGRAPLTGAVERCLLIVAICWLGGTAAVVAARSSPSSRFIASG